MPGYCLMRIKANVVAPDFCKTQRSSVEEWHRKHFLNARMPFGELGAVYRKRGGNCWIKKGTISSCAQDSRVPGFMFCVLSEKYLVLYECWNSRGHQPSEQVSSTHAQLEIAHVFAGFWWDLEVGPAKHLQRALYFFALYLVSSQLNL